jgi:hypothetical protein
MVNNFSVYMKLVENAKMCCILGGSRLFIFHHRGIYFLI